MYVNSTIIKISFRILLRYFRILIVCFVSPKYLKNTPNASCGTVRRTLSSSAGLELRLLVFLKLHLADQQKKVDDAFQSKKINVLPFLQRFVAEVENRVSNVKRYATTFSDCCMHLFHINLFLVQLHVSLNNLILTI